jgi:hypothetical protein
MPARKLMLEHALAELQTDHELLTRKHERLIREAATLRARVRTFEARVKELESGRAPAPMRGRRA